MRTAILTFQDAKNYGAALQAYALKCVCKRYSDVEILNYYNEYFHRDTYGKGVIPFIKKCLNSRNDVSREKKFSDFQKRYLVGDSKILKKEDIKKLDGRYDYFITGSDQVWNLDCSGNDMSYFLDFVKISRKVSYAASFGSSFCQQKKIKFLLDDFYKISVREKTGQEIIKDTLGMDVPVVLDPTLLICKNEWAELFQLEYSEKYVLMYEVLTGNQLFNYAKKFASEKKLKLICITNSNRIRFGAKVLKDVGPIEWLRLFAGASYVFTNSFHGLAFSLNFNKQFFVELLPPPAQTNTRIVELLKKTNLSERDSSKATKLKKIEYKYVNAIIEEERTNSINYLNSLFKR